MFVWCMLLLVVLLFMWSEVQYCWVFYCLCVIALMIWYRILGTNSVCGFVMTDCIYWFWNRLTTLLWCLLLSAIFCLLFLFVLLPYFDCMFVLLFVFYSWLLSLVSYLMFVFLVLGLIIIFNLASHTLLLWVLDLTDWKAILITNEQGLGVLRCFD